MKYIALIFTSLFVLLGASQSDAQEIKEYETFDSYKHLLHKSNDTAYIVNFWATWCAPCIKEMPAFKQAYQEFKDKKVKFIMTSMDFGGDVESKVKLFMNKHKMPEGMQVVILTDADGNSWINQVNPEWSGSIPATLIYRNNKRDFYEQEFTYTELKQVIQSKLK
jgi:thiol-disulfide isomerase/thioredoxin